MFKINQNDLSTTKLHRLQCPRLNHYNTPIPFNINKQIAFVHKSCGEITMENLENYSITLLKVVTFTSILKRVRTFNVTQYYLFCIRNSSITSRR